MDRLLWHLNFLNSIHDYLVSERESIPFFEVVGLFDKPFGITKFDSVEEMGQILVHFNLSILLCKVVLLERLSE